MEQAHKFNADLVSDLARGKVALFLGSGVSASAVPQDGTKIRTWVNFINSVADEHLTEEDQNIVKELVKKHDYLLACEITQKCLGEKWTELIRGEFSKRAELSELQKTILEINPKIIVTTNFDKLLETNIGQYITPNNRYPHVLNCIDHRAFRAFRDEENYIIKIHGCIDNEETLIFTKREYIVKAYGSPLYKSFFETLLLTCTVLFIGFSMEDPVISMIVDDCAYKYQKLRPHYIFLPQPINNKLEESYKEIKKLYVIGYSPENEHHELTIKIKSLMEQALKRKKEMVSDALG